MYVFQEHHNSETNAHISIIRKWFSLAESDTDIREAAKKFFFMGVTLWPYPPPLEFNGCRIFFYINKVKKGKDFYLMAGFYTPIPLNGKAIKKDFFCGFDLKFISCRLFKDANFQTGTILSNSSLINNYIGVIFKWFLKFWLAYPIPTKQKIVKTCHYYGKF